MEDDDYFITGYTGFCPGMNEHIGRNYHKTTRDIMKVHPHLKTRLSDVHYQDPRRNQGDYNYYYPMSQQYMGAYQVPRDSNVCYTCQGDGQPYNSGGMYVQQSYPLNCSQWGSPCVSKHCNERYSPCLRRQNCGYQDYRMMPQENAQHSQNIRQRYHQDTQPCCNSCAKGGSCSGDRESEDADYMYSRNTKYKPSKTTVDHHRTGGVIPNYMGHIPGMYNSFGEPYGIAASRLLRRHFDDLSRKA